MTINGRSFEVLRLLGHGKGGYSYLVRNESGLNSKIISFQKQKLN